MQSEPHRGTTVTMRLPAQVPETERAAALEEARAGAPAPGTAG
jgi:hypothetical protein